MSTAALDRLEQALGGTRPESVVVCGGAMLQARGLREEISDVDLIVTLEMFAELTERHLWERGPHDDGVYAGGLDEEGNPCVVTQLSGVLYSASWDVEWGWCMPGLHWNYLLCAHATDIVDGWRLQSVAQLFDWKRAASLVRPGKHIRDMSAMASELVLQAKELRHAVGA